MIELKLQRFRAVMDAVSCLKSAEAEYRNNHNTAFPQKHIKEQSQLLDFFDGTSDVADNPKTYEVLNILRQYVLEGNEQVR